MDINERLNTVFTGNSTKRVNKLKTLLRHIIEIVYLSYDYFTEDEIDELTLLAKGMFSTLYQEDKSEISPKDVKGLLTKAIMYEAESAVFDWKE